MTHVSTSTFYLVLCKNVSIHVIFLLNDARISWGDYFSRKKELYMHGSRFLSKFQLVLLNCIVLPLSYSLIWWLQKWSRYLYEMETLKNGICRWMNHLFCAFNLHFKSKHLTSLLKLCCIEGLTKWSRFYIWNVQNHIRLFNHTSKSSIWTTVGIHNLGLVLVYKTVFHRWHFLEFLTF